MQLYWLLLYVSLKQDLDKIEESLLFNPRLTTLS